MAGNVFNSVTKTWAVDSIGTLNEGGVEIQFIYFIPQSAAHDFVLTDNADNAWLSIKADADQARVQYIPFNPPIKLPSLKVATIDGTSTATIQFRTDMKNP